MYPTNQIQSSRQALIHRDGIVQPCALSNARRRSDRRFPAVHASKKGVGTYYCDYNDSALKALAPQASWYYTWSSSSSNVSGSSKGTDGGGLEFVPMIWGVRPDPKQENDNRYIDSEIAHLDRQSGPLLGFNEPDGKNHGQSNIDVSEMLDEVWPPQRRSSIQEWTALTSDVIWSKLGAAEYAAIQNWEKVVKVGKRLGKRLGSPATAERATGSDSNSPTWMERFMDQVNNSGGKLHVDFMCVHWYPGFNTSMTDPEAAAQELAKYMTAVYNKWGKPIWLTEFAYIDFNRGDAARYPDKDTHIKFAQNAVYKLEHLDFVERYAWYALPDGKASGDNNGLFGNGGTISPIGTAYKYATN